MKSAITEKRSKAIEVSHILVCGGWKTYLGLPPHITILLIPVPYRMSYVFLQIKSQRDKISLYSNCIWILTVSAQPMCSSLITQLCCYWFLDLTVAGYFLLSRFPSWYFILYLSQPVCLPLGTGKSDLVILVVFSFWLLRLTLFPFKLSFT